MEQTIAASLVVNTSHANKSVKEFKEELAKASHEVAEMTERFGENSEQVQLAKKKVEDLNGALKITADSGEMASSGLGRVGKALQTLGIITIVIKAFEYFREVLGKNQVVADGFATVMKTLDIVFNDLINFILKNAPKVVEFFKEIFENPGEYVKKLGEAIKDNIIERIDSTIKVFGYLGDVIKKVFKGDFDGAINSAKKAGVEFADVMTGVNNTVERGGKLITDAANAVGAYAKNSWDAANAQIALENRSKLAAAQLDRIMAQYERETELQRQIRDNTALSYDERLAASDKLKKLLSEQEQVQLRLAKTEVERAKSEASRNKNNVDLQVAVINALKREDEIRAQIAGFRSEQLSGELGLLGEVSAAREAENARMQEIFKESENWKDEQSAKDGERLSKDLGNKLNAFDVETQAKADNAATRMEIDQMEMDKARQRSEFMTDLAGKASKLAGEQTAIGKGLAVAQASMDTYAAANDALKANYGPFGPFALAAKIAAVTATVGMGLKNVANIVKIQTKGLSSTSGMSMPSGSMPAPLQPQLIQTSTKLDSESLNKVGNAAAGGVNAQRLYVVSSEMTRQQEVDAELKRKATLGG